MLDGHQKGDIAQDNWTEVVISFQRALRCFSEFVMPIVEAEGCSGVSAENVCFLLSTIGGPRRLADFVIEDRVRGSNISYAIKSLEKDGLVVTLKDPSDARKKVVTPTDLGRRVIDAVRNAMAGRAPDVQDALRSIALFETHCSRQVSVPRRAAFADPEMAYAI